MPPVESKGEARIYCLGGLQPRIMANEVARVYGKSVGPMPPAGFRGKAHSQGSRD